MTNGDIALRLHALGWSPLPLPERAKTPPPTGYTGYSGRYTSADDINRWDWSGNLAIRLPPDVVGVDIDVYRGGSDGLAQLIAKYGELPDTWYSTSRTDGSGIALFRVPNGTTLDTNPAGGIDIVQAHHRYVVCAPSIHPEGRPYIWVEAISGDEEELPPPPDELPDLPWAWIDGLAAVKTGAANAATPIEVRDFIDSCTSQKAPGRLRGVRTSLDAYEGSRHDTLVTTACWALREAAAGAYVATEAIEVLHGWWRRVMDSPERRDGGEFGSAIRWAVGQVLDDPDRVADITADIANQPTRPAATPPRDIDPDTGEVIRDHRNLPDEFWNSRPTLAHIRQAAHARARSADSVLVATLARIATLVHPTVTLPAIVGARGSLNFFGAIVASSGEGKSTSKAIAAELVPIVRKDIRDDISPGSGEGFVEMFLEMVDEEDADGKKRKVKRQTKVAAFVYVDEGQGLLAMGERNGATILPVLRSAWSGAALGQQNASQETNRYVAEHRYRIGMVLGFQLAYAARLIADGEGGTPQRFVFANAGDATIPDDAPEWPGVLPFVTPPVAGCVTIEFDPDIAAGIRRRALGVTRGEWQPDPLDSHADLVRMKVAALLALLDERRNVDAEDWDLAGMIQRTSNAVRRWAVDTARQSEARNEAAYAHRLAQRQAVVEDSAELRALEQGARAIGRKAHRTGDETIAKRTLLAAPASRVKAIASVDSMLELALEKGWIEAVEGGFKPGNSRPT